MKKILLLCLFSFFAFSSAIAHDDVFGFWKTIDDETGKPRSIVAVYPYQGKAYGRLIATYDNNGRIEDTMYEPKKRAPGVQGNPFYSGLDFIWGLKKEGNKYVDGEVMDPEKGRIYGAQMWRKGPNLIMRGQLLFFGVNQVWPPATEKDLPAGFQMPDLDKLVPVIPKVK